MIKALIFDLDGTIADTEKWHYLAYKKTLIKYGIKINQHDFIYKWLKGDASAINKVLNAKYLKNKQQIRHEKELLFVELIKKHGVKKLPGVKKIISLARKNNLKIILASGSSHFEIINILQAIKMTKALDLILGLEDVINNKPSPEMFEKALKKSGLKSSEAVVIENAPNGLKAALDAKIKCIVVPSKLTKKLDFPGADLIVKSLDEITLKVIQKIGTTVD